jgi:hypothetical protein
METAPRPTLTLPHWRAHTRADARQADATAGTNSGARRSTPPTKKSLDLPRERRGCFSKFGGLGFRYRGHSDRRL